ncbi:lysine transporter LysE, partial [Bacillus anthracis]|nr:lysine transporter LysE [Bacillus anthracis]
SFNIIMAVLLVCSAISIVIT